MQGSQRYRRPASLEWVTVATLAGAGKRECAVMKESTKSLAASVPNGPARVIDLGPGTSMNTERNWALYAPDLFAQAVRSFIQEAGLLAVLVFIAGRTPWELRNWVSRYTAGWTTNHPA